jgi:hypothetical protein
MARRYIDLPAVTVTKPAETVPPEAVTVTAAAEPDPPARPVEALEIPTAAEIDEPNRGKVQWVTRSHAVPSGRVIHEYDPISPEGLK